VSGFGAATWQWRYLVDRVSTEEPDNAHGAAFEFAAGLGAIGIALYLVTILCAFGATILPVSAEDGPRQAALLAALAIGVGHMQVDWLWESAATGLLVCALLGLALGAAQRAGRPPRAVYRRLALIGAVVVGVAGIAPALLAERFTDASYRSTPADGVAQAERAAALNPLAAAPEIARADAARRAGDTATAVAALREATAREPRNWVAWWRRAEAERAIGEAETALRSCLEAQHIKPVIECPGQSS
jgi:tetratricopeptide (TPR) repeat protein